MESHRTSESVRGFDTTLYINQYSSGLDEYSSDRDVRIGTSRERGRPGSCAYSSRLHREVLIRPMTPTTTTGKNILCSLRPRPKLFMTRRAKTNVITRRMIARIAGKTAGVRVEVKHSRDRAQRTERGERLPDFLECSYLLELLQHLDQLPKSVSL